VYGEKEVEKARQYFLKTEIPIFLDVNPNLSKFPCITIQLTSSNEVDTEGTLADIHYIPRMANTSSWPALAGPFTGLTYNATTGLVTVDEDELDSLIITPGQTLTDDGGGTHEILTSETANTFTIAANLNVSFDRASIKSSQPYQITSVESAVYREAYAIGCHVDSEPVHLMYLYSTLLFCLLRYKETLLEARGFERTTISAAQVRRDDESLPTAIYSRYCTINGAVRQMWPKVIAPVIDSVSADIVPLDADGVESPVVTDAPGEIGLDMSVSEDVDALMAGWKLKP
jgi:hypothetical protein